MGPGLRSCGHDRICMPAWGDWGPLFLRLPPPTRTGSQVTAALTKSNWRNLFQRKSVAWSIPLLAGSPPYKLLLPWLRLMRHSGVIARTTWPWLSRTTTPVLASSVSGQKPASVLIFTHPKFFYVFRRYNSFMHYLFAIVTRVPIRSSLPWTCVSLYQLWVNEGISN
jgi:hypothetical protein